MITETFTIDTDALAFWTPSYIKHAQWVFNVIDACGDSAERNRFVRETADLLDITSAATLNLLSGNTRFYLEERTVNLSRPQPEPPFTASVHKTRDEAVKAAARWTDDFGIDDEQIEIDFDGSNYLLKIRDL